MSIELRLIVMIVPLVALYFTVPRVIGAYLRFRGKRIVRCPETRKTVAVEVNAAHAALTAALTDPDLRLRSCSRWPERMDCGQECLLQVELSPENCLVRNILKRWYETRQCSFCRRDIGEIGWSDHKPGLLNAAGEIVDWSNISAERLPEMLETHRAVCWDCVVIETFCRVHPDLIADRSRFSASMHRELVH